MPAVYDFSVEYETSTADGGLTFEMPNHQAGHLLLAYLASDTGAPVFSTATPGWALLWSNTTTACFWKKAASAAEASLVVAATVVETYSGFIVSFEDVDADVAPVFSQTTATGTRIAMPQPAIARANSLVLYGGASTGNNAGLFGVEGDMNQLAISDGTAEGVGCCWALEKAVTATSTLRYMIAPVSISHKFAVVLAPPASGATVIPPHILSDPSTILDTAMSSTSYDANVALANTADTAFGTTIGGKTCNDATASSTADIGLDVNSYHTMNGITNAATANAMSGAQIVLAASRYNVGSRNILTCVRRAAPNNIQTHTSIASGRGTWMGIRSGATNATNYKVWQVYAKDVPTDFGNPVPVVINADNTDNIAALGTLVATDVRNIAVWRGGAKTLTGKDCFGMIWAMGTTVVSSGSGSLDMVGLRKLLATDKERLSIMQQGANQFVMYQLCQLGDGTNAVDFSAEGATVEFPSKRNTAKKLINFNGTDNSLGFILYPPAGGSINFKNATIAAASRQTFQVHASASPAATWDFNGCKLAGLGDVQLRAVTTWTGVTFDDCLTIAQNSAAIDGCTFAGSHIISATLADMGQISNSPMTSAGTGHAIEVSGTAGTVSLSGLNFTGYAAMDGSTGNEAIYVNIATGSVTINIGGGGNTPSIRTAGATVTVNNAVAVTVAANTSLVGAEVRVYELDGAGGTDFGTELAGTESHTTATYIYSGSVGNAVLIQIMKPGFKEFTQAYTMPSIDTTLDILLIPDTNA